VADLDTLSQRSTPEAMIDLVLQEWRTGEAELATWKTQPWQEIADYVMPRKSEINTKKTAGIDGFTDQIYDTTAIHANTTLAAGQMDFLVAGKWFTNRAPFEDASDAAKDWYKKTGEKMMDVINGSNFEMEIHSFFNMRGAFGTSHFHVEEDDEEVIYCKSEDIGTYAIFENARGIVNKVIVLKEYTAPQLMEEYGEVGKRGNRGVSSGLKERAQKKGKDQRTSKVQVLIWIGPRPGKDIDIKKIDALNMPIRTLHVAIEGKESSQKGELLRESGYEETATMVSRWAEWGDNIYGYCPSVEVLPTIRQVNFIEENLDTLGEVMVNPRLLYPSNLEGEVNLRAGGVTIFDEGNLNAKPEEWLTAGRLDVGKERIEFKRSQINQAFFQDLFQLLTGLSERAREKTAFEVANMLAEKVGRFHPTFTRLNTEFSKPFLNRVFGICFRAGIFGDPPADVFRKNRLDETIIETPRVVFTSKMAMLLRARENNDFMAFLQMAEGLLEADPGAFARKVNVDRSLDTLEENQGVNSSFFNTPEEREAVAAGQQVAAQQQAALETAEVASKAAANLGKAPEKMLGLSGCA